MTTGLSMRTITVSEAINEALRLEMRRDPTVILLGEDIAGGANLEHLEDEDAWGGPLGESPLVGEANSVTAGSC